METDEIKKIRERKSKRSEITEKESGMTEKQNEKKRQNRKLGKKSRREGWHLICKTEKKQKLEQYRNKQKKKANVNLLSVLFILTSVAISENCK